MPAPQSNYFQIPKNFASTYDGYEFLSKINIETYSTSSKQILFDFLSNDWFDINLCAPLGALIEDLKARENKVYLFGYNDSVEKAFKKNGFYCLVDSAHQREISYTSNIDYMRFTLADTTSFQKYVNDQLLSHSDLPTMSELLKKKITKAYLRYLTMRICTEIATISLHLENTSKETKNLNLLLLT